MSIGGIKPTDHSACKSAVIFVFCFHYEHTWGNSWLGYPCTQRPSSGPFYSSLMLGLSLTSLVSRVLCQTGLLLLNSLTDLLLCFSGPFPKSLSSWVFLLSSLAPSHCCFSLLSFFVWGRGYSSNMWVSSFIIWYSRMFHWRNACWIT